MCTAPQQVTRCAHEITLAYPSLLYSNAAATPSLANNAPAADARSASCICTSIALLQQLTQRADRRITNNQPCVATQHHTATHLLLMRVVLPASAPPLLTTAAHTTCKQTYHQQPTLRGNTAPHSIAPAADARRASCVCRSSPAKSSLLTPCKPPAAASLPGSD
jgi:hypothetical protein